ncbi:PEMT/PEM2 methyltransferase family protein [Natronococcus sp. A-GB7]|uniref:methyltransferase family protein n=1 Tax=Natronococcus sp. A-GB7 TaxID=3037649 RepID=UPI00241F7342|nr:PEMT/PEM2 methyltransferase family protein [Natronococcus sp. A-GB7]MDG5821024.1 phosphatidylethanolamine N-methyltransferase family protein [Natronococcus sp. A-GB7]
MVDWSTLESLTLALFAVGIGALSLNAAGVAASAVGAANYWPPGERGWRFYAQWTLSQTFTICLLLVAIADPDQLGLPRGPSLVVGLALFVPGFAIAIVAGVDLGGEETVGLTGELRTDGWYRYSRNPQYVGYIAASVGFALLANSALVAVLCAVYVGWWLLLPLAEEPWLREQYGEEYERYAERVPRFVGVETVRAFRSN